MTDEKRVRALDNGAPIQIGGYELEEFNERIDGVARAAMIVELRDFQHLCEAKFENL